jgi:H+-transporting ATPase
MMLGLLMTGHAILTPILMVLVMITGDFLTMSLATDKVTPSAVPNAWRIDRLTQVSIVMGSGLLALFVAVLATGFYALQLTTGALQTLAFVVLVFGGQATLFSIREKRHLWASWPGFWIVASALLDMAITSTLALSGLVSTPLPVWLVASTWAAAFVFAFLLDAIKGVLFARIKMT